MARWRPPRRPGSPSRRLRPAAIVSTAARPPGHEAAGVAGVLVGAFVMHDWPPFMSYVILLMMAIGLIRAS